MCCVAKFVLPANKAAAFKLKIPSLSPALGPNHCQPQLTVTTLCFDRFCCVCQRTAAPTDVCSEPEMNKFWPQPCDFKLNLHRILVCQECRQLVTEQKSLL